MNGKPSISMHVLTEIPRGRIKRGRLRMEDKTLSVSVIVPIYNVSRYLRQCLDSLKAQTLRELEVILVNDGSTDDSGDIAKEYADRYPELFSYYEEKNSGLSAARNYGFSLSHGEYIAFVDSDDYVMPDIYRKMYGKAKEDDSDLVCCAYDQIVSTEDNPEDTETVKRYRFYAMYHSGHPVSEYPSLLLESASYACNKLFRRKLLEEVSFPVGQKYEDSAVTYRMMEMANRISLVNEPGYCYRVHRAGAITADVRGIWDIFRSMDSLLSYYRGIGKAELFHDELSCLCFRHLLYARKPQLSDAPFFFVLRYAVKAFRYLKKNCPDWRKNKYFYQEYTLFSPKYEAKHLLYQNPLCYAVSCVCERIRRKISGGDDVEYARKKKAAALEDVIPLAEDVLQDIQGLQRRILEVIHSFCQENGLRYYAAEGSLLGAVRHQGFVPWDDDMDLVMPREDYEKLISLWGKKSISGCVLLAAETYDQHYLPFIKIIQNENVRYHTATRRAPAFFRGLSIDIFPLDSAVEFDSREELKRLRRIRVLRDMMLCKVNSLKSRARKISCLLRGASFRSMQSLQEELKEICTQYNDRETSCLANYASAYPPVREIFPREWWGEPVPGRFDDTVINLPREGGKILNRIYGAYEELPPEQQRICKHRYEKVKKDGETQAP